MKSEITFARGKDEVPGWKAVTVAVVALRQLRPPSAGGSLDRWMRRRSDRIVAPLDAAPLVAARQVPPPHWAARQVPPIS